MALWILLLVIALLVLLLYRHFGLMSLATSDAISRDGLGVGEAAPPLTGVDRNGDSVSWRPATGESTFLFFAASGCKPCGHVMPHVETLVHASEIGQISLSTLAVLAGKESAAVSFSEAYGSQVPCIADDGTGAFNQYRVRVTPFGCIVDRDGRIAAKGLCSDVYRLRDLLEGADLRDAAAVVDARSGSESNGLTIASQKEEASL